MAAMALDFNIGGLADLQRRMEGLARGINGAAGQALREEAEIEMTEAKMRTPVDTGALRASGRVEGPRVSSDEVAVSLQFGDAAATYALYVHENLEAHHPVGEAKFLEKTLIESQPHMADRIARRLRGLLGR
jgi:hypothetical protein